jgi:hypothetical protein
MPQVEFDESNSIESMSGNHTARIRSCQVHKTLYRMIAGLHALAAFLNYLEVVAMEIVLVIADPC